MKRVSLILMISAFVAFSISAEVLDPVFDSILAEDEKTEAYDEDAYYKELVKAYGGEENEQFQNMQKQLNEYEERESEAKARRTTNRRLIFALSLMIALFPTCVILIRVIKGELKPANTAAVCRTVGVLLFYGIVLFALNYAWLWIMFTGKTKIMGLVLGLGLLAFVIFAIYTLRKSKDN